MSGLSVGTYSDLLLQFKRFCEDFIGESWEGTRLGSYYRTVEKLEAAQGRGNIEDAGISNEEGVTALYEMTNLVEVARHFKPEEIPPAKLSDLAKGPIRYTSESTKSSSNRSRNTAFELVLAARCRAAGINATIDEHLDFIVRDSRGVALLVEAKRLQSVGKLKSQVGRARKQLRSNTVGAARAGLVALDVTKLINTSFGVLRCRDPGHLAAEVLRHLRQFLYEHEDSVAERLASERYIGGFLLHLSGMAVIESQWPPLFFSRQMIVVTLERALGNPRRAVRRLAEQLEGVSGV